MTVNSVVGALALIVLALGLVRAVARRHDLALRIADFVTEIGMVLDDQIGGWLWIHARSLEGLAWRLSKVAFGWAKWFDEYGFTPYLGGSRLPSFGARSPIRRVDAYDMGFDRGYDTALDEIDEQAHSEYKAGYDDGYDDGLAEADRFYGGYYGGYDELDGPSSQYDDPETIHRTPTSFI